MKICQKWNEGFEFPGKKKKIRNSDKLFCAEDGKVY